MPTDSTAPPCVGGNHMVGPIRVAAVDECLGRDEEGGFVTRPWCGSRGYIQVGMRGNVGGIAPRPSKAEAGAPHGSENY